MMQTHQPTLPPLPVYAIFDVEQMIAAATRLGELLTEENNLLTHMRLKELEPLQTEKRALTQQVESFQRMLATDNQSVRDADPARRDLLISITGELFGTIERNLYLTRVAQSVNQMVMQTIVDAMSQQHRVGTYGNHGQSKREEIGIPLSINLNERA